MNAIPSLCALTSFIALAFVYSSHAADMTARDVTAALFQASVEAPPDFSGKDLSGLDLSGLDFKEARLGGANLTGADLSNSNLAGANLAKAKLDRATIIGADFSAADLSGVTMLRPNAFADMESAGKSVPRFAGAQLTGAHINGRIDGVDFQGADLTRAFFGPRDPREEELITPRMEMRGCDFSGALLRDADLSLNALENAKFVDADLKGANLAKANLSGADFTGADVTGADFTDAVLKDALFLDAIGLEAAKGLPQAVIENQKG